MTFRPALESDIATLVVFQQALARDTEGLDLKGETLMAGISHILRDASTGRYYVYEVAGTPVACLLTIPEWSDWRNGRVLWIHSVYVHPDYRRRGLFTSMYETLKAEVQSDPRLYGLRLYVDKSNRPAQCVYRSLGMSDEHYQLFEWQKNPTESTSETLDACASSQSMAVLLAQALPIASRLMLRSPAGLVELRGIDLTLKSSEKSVTVYHADAESSETRSHVHLSHGVYSYCRLAQTTRGTAYLAFLEALDHDAAAATMKVYLKKAWCGPKVIRLLSPEPQGS